MEMERRGENSDRGDINREAHALNTLTEERNALDAQISQEQEKLFVTANLGHRSGRFVASTDRASRG